MFVACGKQLREIEGNITLPTSLPFNETSYFCSWTFKPPEYINGSATDNSTGVTLTIKVSSNFQNSPAEEVHSHLDTCSPPLTQFIELSGKKEITNQLH